MTATAQLTPHDGERVELSTRHGPVAALRGAAPAQGTPSAVALLVPGYTGSKEDFAPVLDGCSTAGLLPFAIDLPGQFDSPGPDDESAYLPDALGEVLAELVTTLTDLGRVLLLGHSYGGLVARAAVLAGAPVDGLTLLDSGPGHLPEGRRRQALLAGEPVLRTQGVSAVYELRERLTTQLTGNPPTRDELSDFLRRRFVASTQAGLLGMARGLRTEPDRVGELADALHGRRIPALVVAGEHDDAWSVEGQREMASRLHSPFATVDGAAHSPNTENPKGLLDALLPVWQRWLGNGRSQPPEHDEHEQR